MVEATAVHAARRGARAADRDRRPQAQAGARRRAERRARHAAPQGAGHARVDALVPALDGHAAAYLDAIADELLAAAVAGAAEFGAKDTKTLRRTLDRAGVARHHRGHSLRTDLVGPLRDRGSSEPSPTVTATTTTTTKRVRAVYREWKTQHIDDQLDDVFRFAFGGGLAVTAEPGRTDAVWTIDPGEAACADCEDNSLAGRCPAPASRSPPGTRRRRHTPAAAASRCPLTSSLAARCGPLPTFLAQRSFRAASRVVPRIIVGGRRCCSSSSSSGGPWPSSTSMRCGTTRSVAATCSGARCGRRLTLFVLFFSCCSC